MVIIVMYESAVCTKVLMHQSTAKPEMKVMIIMLLGAVILARMRLLANTIWKEVFNSILVLLFPQGPWSLFKGY